MPLLEVHSCHSLLHKQQLLWRRWSPTKVGMKNVFKLAREVMVCINLSRKTCCLPRWICSWGSLKTEPMRSKKSYCRHRIFVSMRRTHAASQKGPLDGADPPSFSARVVDPAQSSQDVPVNLTLQLTRRESLLVGGTCRRCQTVPNVRLWEPIWEEID